MFKCKCRNVSVQVQVWKCQCVSVSVELSVFKGVSGRTLRNAFGKKCDLERPGNPGEIRCPWALGFRELTLAAQDYINNLNRVKV